MQIIANQDKKMDFLVKGSRKARRRVNKRKGWRRKNNRKGKKVFEIGGIKVQ